MLEILAMVGSGIFGGVITYVGIKLHRRYIGWRHLKNWERLGRQWKYLVDYSTRLIVPETVEEERQRIEHARAIVNSYDLRTLPDDVDEGFTKTLEYLQDEENPNRLSTVSEWDEQCERIAEVERQAELRTRELA